MSGNPLTGTVQQVAAAMRGYAKLGVHRIVFSMPAEPAISAVIGESCHVEAPRGPVFGLRWRGGGQPLA
jgi:hypothetical protein